MELAGPFLVQLKAGRPDLVGLRDRGEQPGSSRASHLTAPGSRSNTARETLPDELDFDYHLSRTRGPHRSQLNLGYEVDRDEGIVKDNDWNLRLSQERDLGERHFVASRFTHRGDVDGGERERARTLAFSAGWRLFREEQTELRIGPGDVWDLADGDGPAQEHGPALYANWRWRLVRDVPLSGTTVCVGSPLASGRDCYWESEVRLDRPLTRRFGLAWTWDYARNTYRFNPGDSSKMRWRLTWKP